ncbi:MAG TPA: hypothetical protein VMU59_00450 [Caulobacteraceae bacterium]|nr:hypothetical protein [Caulobacteraceae bacterium]
MVALAVACVPPSVGRAQTAPAPKAEAYHWPPQLPAAPLFFRAEWTATPHQHPVTQADLANPNLELKLYGPSGKQIATASQGAPSMTGAAPTHVYTGLCEQTCAAALRDPKNYVDLSGLGKIRWEDKISGLHRVHPIVKLADGTWLVGEHGDSNEADFHANEFTLSESRWIRLDIDRVVTRDDWMDGTSVDFSKVDEVGFTSLMPGSGHGDGGYMDMGWIEVYGNPVPRTAR